MIKSKEKKRLSQGQQLVGAVEQIIKNFYDKKSVTEVSVYIGTIVSINTMQRTARIRLPEMPINGSQDLQNVPIKTLELISANDYCMILSYGKNLNNSYIIGKATKSFDIDTSLIITREEYQSLVSRVEALESP